MAFDEALADRIRIALADVPNVVEQYKFGGISFMVNDKMCIRAHRSGDIMMPCEPALADELLSMKGVRPLEMKGKPMKGWLLVGPEATSNKKDFDYWVALALDFNRKTVTNKTTSKSSKIK